MDISNLSDFELVNLIHKEWCDIVLKYISDSQPIRDIKICTIYTDEFLKRMYIAPGEYYLNYLHTIGRPADNIIVEYDLSITFKYNKEW